VAGEDEVVNLYDASYGGFASDVYGEVRRAAWGDEIGQNSWLTRDELARFVTQLGLEGSSRLLEVGCGSGGSALEIVRSTGCEVVGVDLHEDAVANASRMAREAGLDARASFVLADAAEPLPFEADSFGALLCIDTVNHLRNRSRVFGDWARMLAPGGRLLFTDPITVTGPLGSDEIAIRASIGYFLFVPPGQDQRLLRDAGLTVLAVDDATENMAAVAERWQAARAERADRLREIEGDDTFDGQQRFLEVTARLAAERRLSRFVYLAEKPR
jgi:cyclopropane fatty-acyl-phospholipid synthase-like methyltransferase